MFIFTAENSPQPTLYLLLCEFSFLEKLRAQFTTYFVFDQRNNIFANCNLMHSILTCLILFESVNKIILLHGSSPGLESKWVNLLDYWTEVHIWCIYMYFYILFVCTLYISPTSQSECCTFYPIAFCDSFHEYSNLQITLSLRSCKVNCQSYMVLTQRSEEASNKWFF